MPKVKIRDIEIYYEVKGRGPRLLYIGGTGPRIILSMNTKKHIHIE